MSTGEDEQAQTALAGEAILSRHTQDKLEEWKRGVIAGDHPYLSVPEGSAYRPKLDLGKQSAFTKTTVKKATDKEFNGDYYHSKEIKNKDIQAAAESAKPGEALEALEAKWRLAHPVEVQEQDVEQEMPVEQATHNRKSLSQKAPQLLIFLVVAAGVGTWLYHSHEVKRRAAEAAEATAAATEEQARLIVAGVRNTWNAADDWEDALPAQDSTFAPYTAELEKALKKGRPIVAFGLVDDVRNSVEPESSIVLIQDFGRTTGIDLRFSLLSAPATTKAILSNKDRSTDMFVLSATITSVEKVAMPLDKNDNDQDYFLAHGILHEARPIGFRDEPPKK